MSERILRQPGGMGLSLRSKSRRRFFHPSFVPELARGYWWEVSDAIGLGTAGFKVPEGGGHSSFDLILATVASQPTALAENGGAQFRMRSSADAAPTGTLATSGNVQAGWTGPTYVGMWIRVPNASGNISGPGSSVAPFSHNTATGTQRRLSITWSDGTPDAWNAGASDNGAQQNTHTARCACPANGTFQYIEQIYDLSLALGGVSPGDVIKLFSNLVRLSLSVTVPTTAPLVLNDASTPIRVATFGTGAGVDTVDWSACYYGNGIPSLANRVAIANRRNPTGILLTA